MKYIITGSSGQLAKAFIKKFTELNFDFIAPSEQDLDITNKEKISNVFSQYNPDVVINCAAYNNVEFAQQDNTKAVLINKTAVTNLVEETKKYNAKFVHFGTDYVFDGTKNDLYVETDKTNPLNEYGKSKLAGEQEALKYNNSLVCRLSWVIGEGQQNFLFKLSGWLKNNKVIKVSSDEISVPCFSFDIANTVITALDKELCGLYHLTNSGKASRYELATEFVKLNKFDNEIVPVPMASFNSKVQRPLFTAMSNKKISTELNINIPDWKEALKKYKANF
ncbi:MAG: dTDP-4-dehydrorhamnose reductase [Endomicrobiaceae bacterium]|nr:dTDP-4-dehydrorhamnose reductase [Endomicrobiaceae bacterium]